MLAFISCQRWCSNYYLPMSAPFVQVKMFRTEGFYTLCNSFVLIKNFCLRSFLPVLEELLTQLGENSIKISSRRINKNNQFFSLNFKIDYEKINSHLTHIKMTMNPMVSLFFYYPYLVTYYSKSLYQFDIESQS